MFAVKEFCGTISRFSSFSEKYCWAISVCDVTDDFQSGHEADFHREYTNFLSSEPGSHKVCFYFYRILCVVCGGLPFIFTEYCVWCVVVCLLELQGIDNMWTCPILMLLCHQVLSDSYFVRWLTR